MKRFGFSPVAGNGLLCFIILVLQLCSAGRANAALLFSESFDYAADSALAGQAGGGGFAGPWTGSAMVQAPGLVYPGIPSTGNAVQLHSSRGAAQRPLSAVYETTDTVQWLAFLIRLDAAAPRDANAYGGVSIGPAAGKGSRLFVGGGFQDNQTTWGMNTAGTGNSSRTKSRIVPGRTTLLVTKISHRAGDDLIELFVNPSLAAEPTKPDATKEYLDLSASSVNVESRDASWTIDEIRFGDSFFDVLGKPSAEPPNWQACAAGAWIPVAFVCVTLALVTVAHIHSKVKTQK